MTASFVDEPVVDPATMTDRELLIRMDGKITTGFTSLFQSQSGLKDELHDTRIAVKELSGRVTALERAKWYLAGAAAAIGALGGGFFGRFTFPS